MRTARKKRFSIQEEKRIAQEIDLLTYLTKLIKNDKEIKVESLKQERFELDMELEQLREIEEKCVSISYGLSEKWFRNLEYGSICKNRIVYVVIATRFLRKFL